MCFCFNAQYHIDTLSSPGTARVISGLNVSSVSLFIHSVTWIESKQVLFKFNRFSSELFAISFKTLLANFPHQLTVKDNT